MTTTNGMAFSVVFALFLSTFSFAQNTPELVEGVHYVISSREEENKAPVYALTQEGARLLKSTADYTLNGNGVPTITGQRDRQPLFAAWWGSESAGLGEAISGSQDSARIARTATDSIALVEGGKDLVRHIEATYKDDAKYKILVGGINNGVGDTYAALIDVRDFKRHGIHASSSQFAEANVAGLSLKGAHARGLVEFANRSGQNGIQYIRVKVNRAEDIVREGLPPYEFVDPDGNPFEKDPVTGKASTSFIPLDLAEEKGLSRDSLALSVGATGRSMDWDPIASLDPGNFVQTYTGQSTAHALSTEDSNNQKKLVAGVWMQENRIPKTASPDGSSVAIAYLDHPSTRSELENLLDDPRFLNDYDTPDGREPGLVSLMKKLADSESLASLAERNGGDTERAKREAKLAKEALSAFFNEHSVKGDKEAKKNFNSIVNLILRSDKSLHAKAEAKKKLPSLEKEVSRKKETLALRVKELEQKRGKYERIAKRTGEAPEKRRDQRRLAHARELLELAEDRVKKAEEDLKIARDKRNAMVALPKGAARRANASLLSTPMFSRAREELNTRALSKAIQAEFELLRSLKLAGRIAEEDLDERLKSYHPELAKKMKEFFVSGWNDLNPPDEKQLASLASEVFRLHPDANPFTTYNVLPTSAEVNKRLFLQILADSHKQIVSPYQVVCQNCSTAWRDYVIGGLQAERFLIENRFLPGKAGSSPSTGVQMTPQQKFLHFCANVVAMSPARIRGAYALRLRAVGLSMPSKTTFLPRLGI